MNEGRPVERASPARAKNGPRLAAILGGSGGAAVDTLVDPIEMLSSSHMRAAAPIAPPPARASLPSDPDAEVQWFARVFDEEASGVDIEIAWDDEDSSPTLVLHRPC
jgi:hypothetical protein